MNLFNYKIHNLTLLFNINNLRVEIDQLQYKIQKLINLIMDYQVYKIYL